MGSVASQARVAIKKLRAEGLKIGILSLRLFRPYPYEEMKQFFKDKENVIVFDRDIGYGYEGVLSYELKAALYGLKNRPNIKGYIVGLGGRDVKTEHIITGVHKALEEFSKGISTNKTDFLGLRLDELKDYDESTYFKSG
jgi:pyruvate ferredoxin oxidoreductase alpha subunit